MTMTDKASWNQKYQLIIFAKQNNYPKILELLEKIDVTNAPMDERRYKKIRNAILFNEPALAIKLLLPFGNERDNMGEKTQIEVASKALATSPMQGIVMPQVTTDEAVAAWEQYEDLKRRIAKEDDIQIIGLTPIGRTTVRVLLMNMSERVESRQVLAAIDEYPCKKA
jgi:hypothetical protein